MVAIDTVNELPLVVAAIEPEVGEILISHAVVSVYIWSDHSLDWINKGVGVVKLSQISEQMHRIGNVNILQFSDACSQNVQASLKYASL